MIKTKLLLQDFYTTYSNPYCLQYMIMYLDSKCTGILDLHLQHKQLA